jgi:HEAT repeat protein
MHLLSRLSAVSFNLAALAALSPASAQPRPPAPAAVAPARPLTLREATQRLQSADPDEITEGVDALTRIGTAEAVPPLVTLVRSGLPDDLLDLVVTKLGILGRPEAIEELGSLLRHRRPAVRLRAVTSLSQIRDDRARPLIESGLRDSNNGVRAEAARALGRINARGSLALLQRAFERNIPEAAESIGALGDAAAADHLLESVGRAPLSVLLPGFRRFLDRRDLPDPVKLRIVEQLVSRSPTTQVKAFLQEWVHELPPADRSRARARAELAIRQINDAPSAGAPR